MWRSITIGPRSEDDLHKLAVAGLPPICLQLTRSFRFHADSLHATTRRCPHGKEYLGSDDIIEDGSNSECDNEGDKSLRVVAFGDFAHGGRRPRTMLSFAAALEVMRAFDSLANMKRNG